MKSIFLQTVILTFIYVTLSVGNLAAQTYSFYGVLLLQGKKENSISYRLEFTEKDGVIRGYSITDITGPHETKNEISGTYNAKTKLLSFTERDIVYTKSPLSEDIFCFVGYTGKIRLSSAKAKIEGNFKGAYRNKKPCIDGTLTLIGSATVEKLLKRATKEIESSKKIDEETKKIYNPSQIFDSLQTQQLTKGENLNIFLACETVSLTIWDKNKEDGDVITLSHNGTVLLDMFRVANAPHTITVPLAKGENVFTFEAVNEGTMVPNTAMVILKGNKTVEFQSNLKKGERATVRVLRGEE